MLNNYLYVHKIKYIQIYLKKIYGSLTLKRARHSKIEKYVQCLFLNFWHMKKFKHIFDLLFLSKVIRFKSKSRTNKIFFILSSFTQASAFSCKLQETL